MTYRPRYVRRHEAGGILLEFAMVAPLLIVLAIPVFYIIWNLNAQTVITNAAREMANLAARPVAYTKTLSMQEKMDRIGAWTPPLALAKHGNIIVTEFLPVGQCSISMGYCQGKAVAKWKWKQGLGPTKTQWGQCDGKWLPTDGSCDKVSGKTRRLPYGPADKPVYIAEINYQLPVWVGLPGLGIPGLKKETQYAWAIF